ncbi:hypothetical protein MNBD_NITROSPIRAE01-317 [hydrothermal vent metagenome]|uniref:Uncharacterized protein n=1 Tax=hydrothermal vent metagenome TaxID=652676 RepID=A0A3B1D8X2_9ZZZZ
MKFSFKTLTNKGLALFERLTARTSWKEDLSRGLRTLFTGGVFLADRSFSEIEIVRLRRQREQIEEKLVLAYHMLGKKSMDHWKHRQNLEEKEKNKIFQQIDDLLHEQEKFKEQIAAAKNTPPPDFSNPSETSSE